MKLTKRLAALALAVMMAATLTGCDVKAAAQDMVVKLVVAAGFIEPDDGSEETTDIVAAPGGSVTFPEGMETTARFTTMVQDGTMYISFNGIANRSTSYFTAAGSSVTITSYATTESTGLLEYKAALWELSDDMSTTTYLADSTVYFTTGGDCYTYTVNGLTPGKRYKVTISYDSGKYYVTGGMTVTGMASDELTDVEGENTNNA